MAPSTKTKRIGKIAPQTKALLSLARRMEEDASTLLNIALRLNATAKLTDAASFMLTIEESEPEA